MSYSFFPYFRQGAGASTITGNTTATGRPQAEIKLHAKLQEKDGALRDELVTKKYTVLGPGDVTGINPSQVILTSPRVDTHDMEPNYLAHIEFVYPGLPWLFTPEGPDGNHLKPWIALVVVEESAKRRVVMHPGSPNPVLEANVAELPDLNESWAWAHVQVISPSETAKETLEKWDTNRGKVLSRLLCPRHLDANKRYVACVVPTFASGVQSGLGQVPNKGSQPAWTADSGFVILPVYYHWRFATGPAGDFETLAQRLKGVPAKDIEDVGVRKVYLNSELSRLETAAAESFSAQTVEVRTAIAHHAEPGEFSQLASVPSEARDAISQHIKFLIDFQERARRRYLFSISADFADQLLDNQPLVKELKQQLVAKLRKQFHTNDINLDQAHVKILEAGSTWLIINGATEYEIRRENDVEEGNYTLDVYGSSDPVVGPPIYGQWHAERHSVDDSIKTPEVVMPHSTAWVTELNTDVEMRAIAAVGTRIVQNDQEELMARAWEQLRAVAEANRRARWGQLYQATTSTLHEHRIKPRELGSLLRLTSPVLGRLPVDEATSVAAELKQTSLPMAVVGANFSRAARFIPQIEAARSPAAQRFEIEANGVPANQQFETAVSSMLGDSFYTRSRERLNGVESSLSPEKMSALLEEAGLADYIRESTKTTIGNFMNRLADLPNTIRTTVSSLVLPSQPEQKPETPPIRPQRFDPAVLIELELDSPQRKKLMDNIQQMRIEPDHGVVPHFEAELQRLTNVLVDQQRSNDAQRLRLSPDLWMQFNAQETFTLEGQNPMVEARYNFSSVQASALKGALEHLQMSEEAQTSYTLYASTRSAVMAQFGVDEPIVPWLMVNQDKDRVSAYIEAVKGIEERLTTPENRVPLPERVSVEPEQVKSDVVKLLDPVKQYEKLLKWTNQIERNDERRPRRRSPSHPIMASPHFVDPVVERLKRIDQQWVLGHADKLPANSISVLAANARFVEALLVGANYEMAREMQWRRYPTDLMGTCFARFWPLSGELNDITPIALWDNQLGANAPSDDRNPGEDAVIVVRGDLLRRYPNTIISAVRGKVVETLDDGAHFVPEEDVTPVHELFRGVLAPDITYAGLDISTAELKDKSGDPNFWFIALTQPVDAPRFGLDDAPEVRPGTPVDKLDELSWQSLDNDAVDDGGRLHANVPLHGWTLEGKPINWGPYSDAGQVASILLQRPFQLLLKAGDYL